MPNFDSGVKSYIKFKATVTINFPVDYKNNADICCYQCKFFSRNNGICQLTKEVSEYPHTNRGGWCPLKPEESESD